MYLHASELTEFTNAVIFCRSALLTIGFEGFQQNNTYAAQVNFAGITSFVNVSAGVGA